VSVSNSITYIYTVEHDVVLRTGKSISSSVQHSMMLRTGYAVTSSTGITWRRV